MSDDIARHLGLTPMSEIMDAEIVGVEPPKKQIVVPEDTTEADRDYKYARDNFYNVIEKGTQALEDLLDVASQSQHPRAYEVLATTMKTLIDANKDLVELSRKKNDEPLPKTEAGKVTNNLFVGSTAELQQIMRTLNDKSTG
jgi:hypothetical protein